MASKALDAKQPPFKCPVLPNKEIQSLITKCESIALENKFLVGYEPKPQIITENNMKYSICLAENLSKKPNNTKKKDKQQAKKSKPFDPFAGPFKAGAHICDLGEHNKYRLILNKFPVLPNHVLIISSNYVKQTNPLNKTDFDIAWKIFHSFLLNKTNQNPFIFLNSGILSGATQMHRHLHCIPNSTNSLLLNEIAKTVHNNDEEKESDQVIKCYDGYSFVHGIILLDNDTNSDELYQYYNILLKWIQNEMMKSDHIDNEYLAERTFSYNLFLTDKILMIIPRKYGAFEAILNENNNNDTGDEDKICAQQIAINALPFAGLIFFNSEQHRKVFNNVSITKILQYCTFPRNI